MADTENKTTLKNIERIIEIENRFPVNKWTINGVCFWHLLRTTLGGSQKFENKFTEYKSGSIKWNKSLF